MPQLTLDQALPLAINHCQSGRMPEAEQLCRQILHQFPNTPAAWNILGAALAALNRPDEAESAYREALRLAPNYLEPHSNLALILRTKGQLGEAIASLQRALQLAPNHPGVLCNLATALHEAGRTDEAIAHARQGLANSPDFAPLHSGLILMLHYSSHSTPTLIREELHRWHARFAASLEAMIQPHTNDHSPNRPLRIGYLSADLRDHAVARFLLPILQSHDRTQFEIHAYADIAHPDATTARLQQHIGHWHPIQGLPDDQLTQSIRNDRIDILIDLSMHTHGNRLLVFARKPAPIQLTWLAYAGSTGLRTIDARLSDLHLDPPSSDLSQHSEPTLHLPTFWCYQPPENAPSVNELPALAAEGSGRITFACLNNLAKLSDASLHLFAQILQATPNSRLLLYAPPGSHRLRPQQILASHAIAPTRLEFLPRLPFQDFLAAHHHIDIALDPFPFGGGTTSCDALYMGIPLITLRGRLAVSRAGASLLSTLNLHELIANTPDEFLTIATQLATNLPQLQSLRQQLRPRLLQSPLTNAPDFTRSLESTFRTLWHSWCNRQN